jgi:hypothetical protein
MGCPLVRGCGGVIGLGARRLKGKRVLTAAEFEGEWQVARVIADRAGGPDARFDGVARFARAAWGLAYAEEGDLRIGGAVLRATRDYRWVFGSDGVEVFFGDGRFFHAFRFDAAEAEHLCGEDLYRVKYGFERWPLWVAEWDVRGPRKEYRMRSEFRRGSVL